MSNLANKFLEAMEIISNSSVASAGFDQSIQVQVDRLKNELDSRVYIVKYNGIEYTAIGTPGYLRGENVWAVVPKGDFTQNLQILGLISDEKISSTIVNKDYVRYETLNNLAVINSKYEDTGDNRTITIFDENTDEWGLRDELTLIINTINTYLAFEIGMEITSNIRKRWDDNEVVSEEKFKELMQNINYGIRFKFNAYEFVFDMNDLQGNPYFSNNIRQTKIFTIPEKNDSLKLEKIELFFTDLKEGDSVTLENFTFSGCREANRQSGLTADLEVVKNNRHIKVLNETFGAYTLKENDGESVISLNAALRQDDVLIQENNLSNYSFAWYIKTHDFAVPARLIKPNYSDENFIGIAADWDFTIDQIDNTKCVLNKYKGSSNIIYLPTSIDGYSVTEYDQNLFENIDFVEALVIAAIDNETKTALLKLTDKAVLYTEEETELEINHKIIYGQFPSLTTSKDWEMPLPRDMFFGRKTWVQCKVIENNTKSKAETDLGLFIDLTKSEPNVSTGAIRKGSQEKEDPSRWYQTIELSLDSNKNIWFKDNKRTNIVTPVVNVEINASLDQVWLGQLLTKTNFLIAQEEWLIMSQPYATSNLIITGDSLFRLREDGSWIGDQPEGKVEANLTIDNEPVKPEDKDNIEYEWFCSSGNQTYLQSITPAEDSSIAYFTLKQQKYSSAYNNNVIYCVAYQRLDNGERRKVGEGEFNLSFLTNGQPGTNGTNYVCRLTFDGGVSFPEYLISTDKSSYGAGRIEVKNIQKGNVIVLDEESISYKYENGDSVQLTEDGLIEAESIDFVNHKYIYAEASDGVSSFSTYLPLIYVPNSSIIKLVEPFSSPVIVFSSSGTIASGLPLVFTLESSETINVPESFGLLSAATLKSNNNISIYVELQEDFTKFDKIVACETLEITSGKDENITLLASIPIILLVNRFENAEINAWNGAEVKIDDNTVLALSAGFGKKETDNSFTGVVLGSYTEIGENETKETHGLFGFNKGKRSFELNAETGEGRIGGWDLKTERLSNETFYNIKKQQYIDAGLNKKFSMFIKPCYYRPKRDENGNVIKDDKGEIVKELINLESKELEFESLTEAWEYEFSEEWTNVPEEAEIIYFPLYFNENSWLYSFTLENVKINGAKITSTEFNEYFHLTPAWEKYFDVDRTAGRTYKQSIQDGKCKIITKDVQPIKLEEQIWIGLFGKLNAFHINSLQLNFTMRFIGYDEEDRPPVQVSISATDDEIFSAKTGEKTVFSINQKGKLFAYNAEIKGNIQAQQGSIGGWEINENTLSYEDNLTGNALTLHGNGSNSKFGDTTLGITAGIPDVAPNERNLTTPGTPFYATNASSIDINVTSFVEEESIDQTDPFPEPISASIENYCESTSTSLEYSHYDPSSELIKQDLSYIENNYTSLFKKQRILLDGSCSIECYHRDGGVYGYYIYEDGELILKERKNYPTYFSNKLSLSDLDKAAKDFTNGKKIIVILKNNNPDFRQVLQGEVYNIAEEKGTMEGDLYQVWFLKTDALIPIYPLGWDNNGDTVRTQYATLFFNRYNSNGYSISIGDSWGFFTQDPLADNWNPNSNPGAFVDYPGTIDIYQVETPTRSVRCDISYGTVPGKTTGTLRQFGKVEHTFPLTNYFSSFITSQAQINWSNRVQLSQWCTITETTKIAPLFGKYDFDESWIPYSFSNPPIYASSLDGWNNISCDSNGFHLSVPYTDAYWHGNENTSLIVYRKTYRPNTEDLIPLLEPIPQIYGYFSVDRTITLYSSYPEVSISNKLTWPEITGKLISSLSYDKSIKTIKCWCVPPSSAKHISGTISVFCNWHSKVYPLMIGKNGFLFLEKEEVQTLTNSENLILTRTNEENNRLKLMEVKNSNGDTIVIYLDPSSKTLVIE